MIQFDLPKEKSSIIKVIGVGGGGSNAVNHMYSQNIEGVNFIICNTDAQAITQSGVPNRIQLGPHLTQGLGAGANPDIGRQATEESLEEIKRILEVNTKMAFITAGMGGGTGTGGAPIISKICKDLGILTVGIVTTPFSYEGKKRQLQAEEGIKNLKQYVDTLLVISNDKLRHQFGNLKMKEAFAKADNVLATAAKCITDVINSTGQINVDFADVCTVMRNGGVAILGNAAAGGENRAQRAIEEALNSPLLNDNDISGAKWILININSAENEHEFTMDEVDIIQNYLLSQAGEGTDVILGMGYDNTLGDQIGITLIATGFEHKDPFIQQNVLAQAQPVQKEEKIILELKPEQTVAPVIPAKTEPAPAEPEKNILMSEPAPQLPEQLTPKLVEPAPTPVTKTQFELFENVTPAAEPTPPPSRNIGDRIEWVLGEEHPAQPQPPAAKPSPAVSPEDAFLNSDVKSPVSGGYLARPTNIYNNESPRNNAEPKANVEAQKAYVQPAPAAAPPPTSVVPPTPQVPQQKEQENPSQHQPEDQNENGEMQLVIKEEIAPETTYHQNAIGSDDVASLTKEEADKRKAMERIQKLRNLSFNINATDPNNEFETVPAYIRRNLDLYNTYSSVENFYSNYEIKTDEDNNSQISTINSFLDGKKPD